MLTPTRYHFRAAALPLALALFLALGSLYSCSENPPTQGKDSCDTCHVTCDTCDTTKPSSNDTTSHDFIWTEYSIPTESNLTGCWVFDDTTIYVNGTRLYMFDAGKWTRKPLPIRNTTREAALADYPFFALSKEDMWFVKGILYHYKNGVVDEYRTPSDSTYLGAVACWGTSSNDLFLVSLQGHISHFNGTTFTKMTSPTTKDLRSVWGTSHNDVWAGGSNYSTGEVVLIHFDGTTWKEVDLNTIGQFGCAGCESVAAVWAVDSLGTKISYVSGGHLHKKSGNKSWSIDSAKHMGNELSSGSWVSIQSIRGNSSTDLICVGDWGFVSHWNGKSWHRYDALYNPGSSLYYMGACDLRGNTACIVGSKGGTSWIAIGRRKPF